MDFGATLAARFALTQEKLEQRDFVELSSSYTALFDFNISLTRTIDAFVVGDAITYRPPISPRFTGADVVYDAWPGRHVHSD